MPRTDRAKIAKESIEALTSCAPELTRQAFELADGWLSPLLSRLDAIKNGLEQPARSKQINDPIWHQICLEPAEVLLLDTPLLQRMRGVRQLGLAHLVFPSATHDRFSHACGVLEAASRMFTALQARVSEQEQDRVSNPIALPKLTLEERWLVRLAALLHDIGHGPFSHAVEPVIKRTYKAEIDAFRAEAQPRYHLDNKLGVAEIVAVLLLLSPKMNAVLGHGSFPRQNVSSAPHELQLRLAILIMGGRDADYNTALSAIISGQADADKLDYLARDAHHSGMPVSFDTDRLLSKLKLIICGEHNLPPPRTSEDNAKIEFAKSCPGGVYLDVGVQNSGVGALEQLLVGRVFLYDRLYFHHKVRAADAMAQRLLLYARSESSYSLRDLYLPVGDDTLIQTVGGMIGAGDDVTPAAKELATCLLHRTLYHRAIAFRARLHHNGNNGAEGNADKLARIWSPISTKLSGFEARVEFEKEIHLEAKIIAKSMGIAKQIELACELQPWHIAVDLPKNRVTSVSIYVAEDGGTLELPNLYFDPGRWSQVYDLEKRTGYVFCPAKFVPLVGFTTRILLYRKWQYVSSSRTNRLTKSDDVPSSWYQALLKEGYLTSREVDVLTHKAAPGLPFVKGNFVFPESWTDTKAFLPPKFIAELNRALPHGLEPTELDAIGKTVSALVGYLDFRSTSPLWTQNDKIDEVKDLQTDVKRYLHSRIDVEEARKLAGGPTDLICERRVIIENKVGGRTSNAFETKDEVTFQANRYAAALCSQCFVSLVAYRPSGEEALLRAPNSIKVIPREIAGIQVAEVRIVVPYGQGVPSSARGPKNAKPLRQNRTKVKKKAV